jgi:hypothetical protein
MELLRLQEVEGRTPILPANLPLWVNIREWAEWPVLSIANGELYMVLLKAKLPRQGAAKRLIAGARRAGLSPVAVQPIFKSSEDILIKHGWTPRVVGEGEAAIVEYRPPLAKLPLYAA